MSALTQLAPTATPGRRYAFSPKAPAAVSAYRIYSGPSPGNLSLLTAVPAGQAFCDGIEQANSTTVYYEIRSYSEAGVEGPGVAIRVAKDAEGNVVYARPNALLDARAEPAAGGKVRVIARYSRTGEPSAARATGVQVAGVVDRDGDWDNALGTMTLLPTGNAAETFDDVYDDGATVLLAARATTGGGSPVYGDTFILPPVVADATAPDEVTEVEASQA